MKIAFVTDNIESFNLKKDSTFMLMCEAQKRGFNIFEILACDLFMQNDKAFANARAIEIKKEINKNDWFCILNKGIYSLDDFDLILMRKDPPFNLEYIYASYILEKTATKVINDPRTLRDFNEKFSILNFPEFICDTLVSSCRINIKNFIKKNKNVVLKPLDKMGGKDIFKIKNDDENQDSILDYLTCEQKTPIMVQKFIDDIEKGDKRILIVNGEYVPFLLKRIPQDSWYGNLAKGAIAKVQKLTDKDIQIAEKVARFLLKNNIYFAGIDIIGDYLTEINITSPTGIQEIYNESSINVAKIFFDKLKI